ncbi:MAG: hypothetical protein NTW21_43010 [Verrucomicrobia bacterium]|nr:hypothetical protein [Verrucomicrobiota bacterium]
MDEVRISQAARSANWVKLEYENQKALQTLVGNFVQPGTTFAVTPTSVNFLEGTTTTITGQASGAQKVYWTEKRNGVDTLLATDTFSLPVTAGRVTGNQSYVIQFKAIYPSPAPNQTVDIPITITEDLPDPVFTLTGPSSWDGRQTITITPDISNLATLQAKNVANSTYNWSVTGVAATKTINAATPTVPGSLTLTRSQGDGPMTVTLVLSNGGSLVSNTKTITVQQPATPDAWVQRTPGANEKPVTKQFFARDPNTNNGTIFYNGTGAGTTSVYLKVFAKPNGGTETPYGATHRLTPVAGAYAFAVPIAAGLVTYKVEFGTTTGSTDTPTHTVTDLVCGDAYLIEGQSNALATDNAVPADTNTSPWIRSYGSTLGWGYATNKDSELQLGVWGWIWAEYLSATYSMPVCIINGAVGGTRIDQHQPNPAGHALPGSLYSIYATLYNRIVGANLTHGIRGVLWHQGEQDQGSGGPDGDYNYKFYQQYFMDMSAAWKQDFPNIQKYYIFQIWPAACGDTFRNDQLREVQRTLPDLYSNMRIMSTLGIVPGSSCHYDLAGYQKFSDLISPLVEQDFYGYSPATVFSAPNLKKACYSTTARNEITLEFDQNIAPWIAATNGLFFLDRLAGKVASGSVTGKVVKLTLTAASTAKTITYLQGADWAAAGSVQGSLIYGSNGIAALTFAEVPLTPAAPTGLGATPGVSQVALTWTAAAGATGYNIKRSTTGGGPYAVIGTTAGTTSYTDSAATNGTTYCYVVSASNTAGESADSNQASATPNTPYGAWAADSALGLTTGVNDGPLDNPDHDGISNVLEFVLGGAPMVPSQTILPKLTRTGSSWFYEYDRSDLSQPPATTQEVEYGNNLTGWASIPIPLTGAGSVAITAGSPTDHVKVTIPAPGTNGFVRLKVTGP